jgi:hypothetical protein
MKLRTNIFYVSVLVIDCHCVGECTLSIRHRLQIRILSAMKKKQTKKGASIAGVWVSSCFIDPSHVVFSLNRKKSKRGAMKCKRMTIMKYSPCSIMLTTHESTSIHNRPESKSSFLFACNKISHHHHVSRQHHN